MLQELEFPEQEKQHSPESVFSGREFQSIAGLIVLCLIAAEYQNRIRRQQMEEAYALQAKTDEAEEEDVTVSPQADEEVQQRDLQQSVAQFRAFMQALLFAALFSPSMRVPAYSSGPRITEVPDEAPTAPEINAKVTAGNLDKIKSIEEYREDNELVDFITLEKLGNNGKYYLLLDSRGVGHPCNEDTIRKLLATGKNPFNREPISEKDSVVGPLTSAQFVDLVAKFLKPAAPDTQRPVAPVQKQQPEPIGESLEGAPSLEQFMRLIELAQTGKLAHTSVDALSQKAFKDNDLILVSVEKDGVVKAYSVDTVQSADIDFKDKEVLGPFTFATYQTAFPVQQAPLFTPLPTPSAPPAELVEEQASTAPTPVPGVVKAKVDEEEVEADKVKQVSPQEAQNFVAQAAVLGAMSTLPQQVILGNVLVQQAQLEAVRRQQELQVAEKIEDQRPPAYAPAS